MRFLRLILIFVAINSLTGSGFTQTLEAPPEPARLTNSHVDLRVVYTPAGTNRLSFVIADEDRGLELDPQETVLVLGEAGKLILPAGTPLGNEGDAIYVAPQSQVPGLLSLGLSAEELPLGVFDGNLKVQLQKVVGPGQFILWQAESPGEFDLRMKSSDGIGPGDETLLSIGSHDHFNWGFSAPGVYQLTFKATGRLLGESLETTGEPSTVTFNVLPLLEVPAAPSLRTIGISSSGVLQLEVTGTPGATYTLQSATDLGDWTSLPSVTLSGPTALFTVPNDLPQRWIRARLP